MSYDNKEKNSDIIDLINNEKLENVEKLLQTIQPECELKSKSFYDKKLIKSKVNFVDKDTNIMSQTNYNSNSSRVNKNNLLLSDTPKNENKTNDKPKQAIFSKVNYSIQKLEPDFNFKSTQIHFNPSKINKNNTKLLFAPVLKYIIH